MKKLLFLFALSLCSIAAWAYNFAAVAPSGQTLYYRILSSSAPYTVAVGSPRTASAMGGSGWFGFTQPSGTLTIPDSVTYNGTTYLVTNIENYAFANCDGITRVTLPNSLTNMGTGAFYDCNELTSVSIGNSVNNIGDETFVSCLSLTSITIPNTVTSIGNRAFSGCHVLTSVTIPNSVTSIGNHAFYDCALTSVTIPNSMTSIARGTFEGCAHLASVTIPNSVTSIGNCAFKTCRGLTNVIIPNSVTTIGDSAFMDCTGLTSVNIPDSVTSIAENTFYNCSTLTSITIPNSVTSIGSGAFEFCRGLTSITIPNSVTSIGGRAFSDCSGLTSITIPNSVTSIGSYAFDDCSGPTYVIIPNSVNSIGSYAFSNVKRIVYCGFATGSPWGASRKYGAIQDSLFFQDCAKTTIADCIPGLTVVNIPNTVTRIEGYAFSSCSSHISVNYAGTIAEWCGISFSNYYANPAYYAHTLSFNGTPMGTTLTIPNSVDTIGNYAFYGCSGLNGVTIPNSVTSIGSWAFYGVGWVSYCGTATGSPWGARHAGCVDIDGDFVYSDNTHTSLIRYIGTGGNVTIPNSVTSIGDSAFYCCSGLTSVTIGNSVTSIGDRAFYCCSGLTSVTIGNSVTSIGSDAFYNCSGLTSVTIPNSVTSIGTYAFYDCSGLTSVTIGNSVTSIGTSAFRNCSGLTNVNFTGTIAEWCGISFSGSSSNPTCYAHTLSFNGTPMGTTLTIPNSVDTIGNYAFYDCSGLTSVTIPNSVTSIGTDAFDRCSGLTNVNFTGTIAEWCGISFGDSWANPTCYAHTLSFNGTPMGTTLTIPNSVDTIGNYAFYDCSGLTSVTIPNSVTSIGDGAFYCTGLTSVNYTGTIAEWCGISFGSSSANPTYYAHTLSFNGTPMGNTLTIPDSVTSIGSYAFSGCSGLSSVSIPDSVTSIGSYAFSGCSGLSSVNIPNSVTSIGSGAFSGVDFVLYCGTATGSPWGAHQGGCFDTDGDFVYADSAHTSLIHYIGTGGNVNIPNSVTSIGDRAFYCCSGLTSVVIPNSVTSIGGFAFYGCSNVDTLYYNAKNLITSYNWYDGYYSSWYGFGPMTLHHLVIGDSVQSLPAGVFYNQNGLTSVTIPNSVTSIGASAFYGCSNVDTLYYNAKNLITSSNWYDYHSSDGFRPMTLHHLVIGDSVQSLPAGVFYEQSGLTSVSIPNSVTSIGSYAFEDCSGLTSVTIPNSVASIGSSAFRGCSGLTSVTIPNSVTSIGSYAFYNCSGLTSVTIPNSVTSIESSAFSGCSGLTSVTIPDSVTTIGDRAFSDCSGLTSVTIPNSVTSIGNYAFDGCSNVDTLYYNAKNLITSSNWYDYHSSDGFRHMTLHHLVIGDSVQSLPAGVFYEQSGLTSVSIPNSVTSIGSCAFYNCSGLTSVTIPNSVASIGSSAFYGCSGLTSVTIPNSVTSIGSSAFRGCSGLTSVTIPDSVTSIGSYAFYNCSGLTSVTIPNSVTSIESYAFSGCSGLTSVTIPDSVTSIGNYAFYGCSGLTSVTIGNSVTSIGTSAFRNCSGLTNVNFTGTIAEWCGISFGSDNANPTYYAHTLSFNGMPMGNTLTIPDSVISIGSCAFYNCSGLTSVTIPNSVTSIGSSAFNGCQNLTNVNYAGTIAEWCGISFGSYANPTYYAHTLSFNGMPMGNTLTIPDSVTSIGSYAFDYCSNLSSVTIGNSVSSIGSYAFVNCSNLKTVYNLSSLSITKGSTSNGWVAYNANRVVKCTEYSGSGDNIIYKIPTTFTIVDNDASTSSTEIPYSTIPTNFLYYDNSAKDGGSWKAKNIVLTDGQDAFEAPETFTAETATYTREFTNSNRSTLYLPFTAAIPENFEVYDFTNFANNTISFTKREDSIYAYTPYLVGYDLSKDGNTTTCTITKTNAVFPKSESANYHPVTRNGMTFQGVLERTEMTSTNNYGYSNGFFVQSGGHAHVNPFRSYFTYTAPAGAPQSLPPTLNVEVGYGDPVGIDAVETPEQEYDGRYGKDVYDMLGRLVRKNADNLEGLPKGVYIWKGKKFMNYDL